MGRGVPSGRVATVRLQGSIRVQVAWFTANSVDWYGGRDCNPRWSAVSVEDVRERIVILGKLASVSDADMGEAAFGLLRDFVDTTDPARLQDVDPVLLAWVAARD